MSLNVSITLIYNVYLYVSILLNEFIVGAAVATEMGRITQLGDSENQNHYKQ